MSAERVPPQPSAGGGGDDPVVVLEQPPEQRRAVIRPADVLEHAVKYFVLGVHAVDGRRALRESLQEKSRRR